MREHEKHTEFLRQCIRYDEGTRRHELVKEIAQIQCDMRCLHRAAWLMAIVVALLVAIVGYGTLLVDNFPYNLPPYMVNLIWALGLGAMASLLTFAGLVAIYRRRLDRHREECRQRVAKLLELRLGKPVTTPSPDTGTIASTGQTRAPSMN